MVLVQPAEINKEGCSWLSQGGVFCFNTAWRVCRCVGVVIGSDTMCLLFQQDLIHYMQRAVAQCQAASLELQVHQAAANTRSEELRACSCN